jgi:hypothetical protein
VAVTHGTLPVLLAAFAGAVSTLGWWLVTAARDGAAGGLRRFFLLRSDAPEEE